jgi:hypothetical protein
MKELQRLQVQRVEVQELRMQIKEMQLLQVQRLQVQELRRPLKEMQVQKLQVQELRRPLQEMQVQRLQVQRRSSNVKEKIRVLDGGVKHGKVDRAFTRGAGHCRGSEEGSSRRAEAEEDCGGRGEKSEAEPKKAARLAEQVEKQKEKLNKLQGTLQLQ